MATVKEARRNVRGAVEDNARRKKKGKEERNRGGTRDAFKLVSTSVHPPLPSPLSPQCFLHREAEKEEFVFFLRHTKSRVYVKERAADYLSSSIPLFSPLPPPPFFFDCLARDRGQLPPFCPRAPPFRGAPLLTRAIFRDHQFGSRLDVFGSSDVPLTIAIQPAWREIMANLRLNYGNAFFLFPFFILHA